MNNISPKWQNLIDVFSERNTKINLSAIRNNEDIYHKHILDALEIQNIDLATTLLTKKGTTACDIGTGGGFPLLPLACIYQDTLRTGLDARRKKIDAINDMITQLNLSKNCKALHGRVEDHKKKYDVVTARAVAYADKLLPWIDSILKSGGHAILYKLFTNEEDALIHKYGRKFIEKHIYTLDNDSVQRCIYILKK